jgi:hypothetical protein
MKTKQNDKGSVRHPCFLLSGQGDKLVDLNSSRTNVNKILAYIRYHHARRIVVLLHPPHLLAR